MVPKRQERLGADARELLEGGRDLVAEAAQEDLGALLDRVEPRSEASWAWAASGAARSAAARMRRFMPSM